MTDRARRVNRLVALVGLVGCNRFFNLEELGEDDPAIDAAVIGDGARDGAIDGLSPPMMTRCSASFPRPFDIPLVADTYLEPGSPALGALPIIRLGTGQVALYRFAIGASELVTYHVHVAAAGEGEFCNANVDTCAACPVPTSGMFTMEVIRSDWDETTATWTERATGQPWTANGVGADDVVAGACGQLYPTDGANIDCAPAMQPGSVQNGMISFAVRLFDNASGVYAARETSCGAPIVTMTGRCKCGDGVRDECDDGNATNGDNCENDCTLPVCGNDIIDANEQCDDGNSIDGDGCSAECAFD